MLDYKRFKPESFFERDAIVRKFCSIINKLSWPLGFYVSGTHYYDIVPKLSDLKDEIDNNLNMQEITINLQAIHETLVELLSDTIKDIDNIVGQHTYGNVYFRNFDALFLASYLRKNKPARVVEIGQGYSTMHMVSEIQRSKLETTILSIDPNPRPIGTHPQLITIASQINREVVNKILDFDAQLVFIDSSHVLKIGSDVSIIFDFIIPRVRSGTVFHFHDIFLPYHYPNNWVMNDFRLWNEQYVLKEFLRYNSKFEVIAPLYMLYRSGTLREILLKLGAGHTEIFKSFPASFYIKKI